VSTESGEVQSGPPQIWWTLRTGEFDLARRRVSLGIILGHCTSTHTTHSCVASARRGTGGLTTQQRASQPYDFANLKPNNKFQESNSQNRARYFFKDVFLERQLPRLSLELARIKRNSLCKCRRFTHSHFGHSRGVPNPGIFVTHTAVSHARVGQQLQSCNALQIDGSEVDSGPYTSKKTHVDAGLHVEEVTSL